MASFWFLFKALFMLPLASLASQLNSEPSSSTVISASPAFPTNDPPESSLSPYSQELSPDILPLLPSPGGRLPIPTGSSMPIIPSNPSPPNSDGFLGTGQDSAVSPFGSLPAFSLAPRKIVGSLKLAMYIVVVYCLIHLPRI